MEAFKRERELILLLQSEGEELINYQSLSQGLEYHPVISQGGLDGIRKEIRENGPFCLIQNYQEILNVQRSLTENINNNDNDVLMLALGTLIDGINETKRFVTNNDWQNQRQNVKKLVAVLLFLFEKFVVDIDNCESIQKERALLTNDLDVDVTNFSKKKYKSKKSLEFKKTKFEFWTRKRENLMASMRSLCQTSPSVLELFDVTNTDYTILRCLTNSICTVIKNLGKELLLEHKKLKGDIFVIFEILCSLSNEKEIILTRLIPLLTRGEDMSKVLSSCICSISEPIALKAMISSAIKVAADCLSGDSNLTPSSERGFSTFLIHLSKERTKECIDTDILSFVFTEFLYSTSFTIRNAVLTMAYETLNLDLSDHFNDEEIARKFRKKVLTEWLLHTKDVNACVRRHSLNLLSELIKKSKTNFEETVLCLKSAGDRIMDISISVRKSALKFLSAVISEYPKSVNTSDEIGTFLKDCIFKISKLEDSIEANSMSEILSFFETLCDAGFDSSSDTTLFIIHIIEKSLKHETEDKIVVQKIRFFVKFYFPSNLYRSDLEIVKRLLTLVETMYEDNKPIVMLIVRKLREIGFISSKACEMLWDAVYLKNENVQQTWNRKDSINAIFTLAMILRTEDNLADIIIKKIVDVVLGERSLNDFVFAESVLRAILIACLQKDAKESTRFEMTSVLFDKVLKLMEEVLKSSRSKISELEFSRLVGFGIRIMLELSFGDPRTHLNKLFLLVPCLQEKDGHLHEKVKILRYLALMTEALQNYIRYYEKTVIPDIRMRSEIINNNKANSTKLKSRRSTSESNLSVVKNSADDDNVSTSVSSINHQVKLDIEMAVMIGNIGYEAEVEAINNYLETVCDRPPFKKFRSLAVEYLKNWSKLEDSNLKVFSLTAMLSIMKVSAIEAKTGAYILQDIWDDTRDINIKCLIAQNIVPLFLKFPNEMEKFNSRLIKCVQDSSNTEISLTCMEVISKLTLAGFIKARDILPSFAICVINESQKIRESAEVLIGEVSEADLRNSVSHIILQAECLDKEDCERMLRFILKKIESRHVHNITETILTRFKATRSSKACHLLAIGLKTLNHTEKSFRTIMDNFGSFSNKLDAEVYSCFLTIIKSLKGHCGKKEKNETQSQTIQVKLQEFEKLLNEHHARWSQLRQIEDDAKRRCEEEMNSQNDMDNTSEDLSDDDHDDTLKLETLRRSNHVEKAIDENTYDFQAKKSIKTISSVTSTYQLRKRKGQQISNEKQVGIKENRNKRLALEMHNPATSQTNEYEINYNSDIDLNSDSDTE